MATLEELKILESNGTLHDKMDVAAWIWADSILSAVTPDPQDRELATRVISNPQRYILPLTRAVLAGNAGLSVAAITGADDTDFITAVNDALEEMANGLALVGGEYA